jgi:hypothetical protein
MDSSPLAHSFAIHRTFRRFSVRMHSYSFIGFTERSLFRDSTAASATENILTIVDNHNAMAGPRRRKHRITRSAPKGSRRSPKARPPRKAPAKKKQAEGNGESVRHYGDSWDFEHYEKEGLKASGLFL